MKAIIISDSFKGTLSSKEISNLFENEFKKYFYNSQLIKLIVSDGGEGTIDSYKSVKSGRDIYLKIKGPNFEEIMGRYYLFDDTAVIESSIAIGLSITKEKNPLNTTTYGVGELIKDAINRFNVKKIYVGLGGSSTNDGGCGCVQALGCKFYNKEGIMFTPTGGTLKDIYKIDNKDALRLTSKVEITLLSDCINPLYGKNGASYIYAKQKGADDKMIETLDDGLKYLSTIYKKYTGKDHSKDKGSGAAGGLSYGLISSTNAKIVSGINYILDLIHFNDYIKDADYVFTGEGKFDNQSFNGKVITGIIERVKKINKKSKIIIISGINEIRSRTILKKNNIEKCYSLTDGNITFSEMVNNAKNNYIKTADKCLEDLKINVQHKKN